MDKQHNWLMAQVDEGKAALTRLSDTAQALRDDWFKIGHALLAGRQLRPANQDFGAWLRENGFDPSLTPMERSCAMRLAKNEAFAREALEGTRVGNVEWMVRKIEKLFGLAPSYEASEDGSHPDIAPDTAVTPETAGPIATTAGSQNDKTHAAIAPRPPGRKGDLEKQIGDDAHYIRAWYASGDGSNLAPGIRAIKSEKKLLAAVAASVKSGECVHAAVAGASEFDIRMVFPHVPEKVARAHGRKLTWQQLRSKPKGRDKSDWERFSELNDICRARSTYSVEKSAPHGTYRLRDPAHEDEIGVAAWNWWNHGHWPGERPKLQVHTNDTAPQTEKLAPSSPADEAVYFGMVLWPIPPSSWRSSDDPTIPTKQDVDNTYWFVEELHRAMHAQGLSHSATARYIRNWSKYIGQLQRPTAAAALMQDMAQGIDIHGRHPDRQLDLKNKMPSRPIKFAAER